jgi:hypothetical protein
MTRGTHRQRRHTNKRSTHLSLVVCRCKSRIVRRSEEHWLGGVGEGGVDKAQNRRHRAAFVRIDDRPDVLAQRRRRRRRIGVRGRQEEEGGGGQRRECFGHRHGRRCFEDAGRSDACTMRAASSCEGSQEGARSGPERPTACGRSKVGESRLSRGGSPRGKCT